MRIAIIAAVARNRVIGHNGRLPWHIPEDLARFKQLTWGYPLLMGRRTHEAIGRTLPGRRNVVLSSATIPGIETCRSLDEAMAALSEEDLVFAVGGSSLFALTLPRADLLYLTRVEQSPDGDAFFPPYEHLLGTEFLLTASAEHPGFRFEDYLRTHQSTISLLH